MNANNIRDQMKVWILGGGGGQLGIAVAELCQKLKIPFVSSVRKETDITDLEQLQFQCGLLQPTHIINCAAFTDVDGAEKQSETAYAVNAKGPENLGRLGLEFPVKVVHVSTDYVFDGEQNAPYSETDRPNPLGIYGKSKYEGELRLLNDLPTACIVRSSWIFSHIGKNFISSVLSLLQNQPHIKAVSDQINRATYSHDLAQALVDLSSSSGIFHFANEKPLSRYQIVQDFYSEAKKRGFPIKCEKISSISSSAFPSLSPRPPYSVLDTHKVERTLGRKPRMWETVLGDYLNRVSISKHPF